MAPIVDVHELTCSIPPTRFFKAFDLDSANFMPKAVPSVFKSAKFVEGNGGAGSVILFTLDDGKTMKHKIDEVDEANHVYKFTITEGPRIGDNYESVKVVNEVVAGPDGGCILRATSTYIPKGDDHNVIQEGIKQAKEGLVAFFQAAVAHLHANPNEYS